MTRSHTNLKAAAPARQGDVITQSELQAILDRDYQLDRTVCDIRRRLFAGASVEPGAVSLDNENEPVTSDEELLESAGRYREYLDIKGRASYAAR